ncbi:hypothetical protein ACHAWF_007708, partial [Thalassiosira exigua]
ATTTTSTATGTTTSTVITTSTGTTTSSETTTSTGITTSTTTATTTDTSTGTPLFFAGDASSVGEEAEIVNTPRTVGLDVLDASAGNGYTLAILKDRSVVSSGYIDDLIEIYYGQFGVAREDLQEGVNKNKMVTKVTDVDGNVIEAPEFRKVVAGYFHSIFIDVDGNAYASGLNDEGQLCYDGGNQYLPRQIILPDGQMAIDAAVGYTHTLILTDRDIVYGCGSNGFGELGLGSNVTSTNVPDNGNDLKGVTGVAAGTFHSLIMTANGLYGMGGGFSGQLCTTGGIGFTPEKLSAGDIQSFTAGSLATYFLLGDGTITACGRNQFGELGDGTNNRSPDGGTSVKLDAIPSNIVDVYAGPTADSAFLRAEDGTLWGMGWNAFGQIGVGDTSDRNVPTEVHFGDTAPPSRGVSAGNDFTIFW